MFLPNLDLVINVALYFIVRAVYQTHLITVMECLRMIHVVQEKLRVAEIKIKDS